MGGGLMQLVAYGAQDIYLTGNPQITFFKAIYRRHTNFAIESIQQTIDGTSTLSTSNSSGVVSLSRNGDLVGKIYVTTKSTSKEIINGSKIISEVELEIGGQTIDKQYQEWLDVWNELSIPHSKSKGFKIMTGCMGLDGGASAKGPEFIQVPLNFWFCRNPGSYLPLIALQYHDVKLKFTWGRSTEVGASTVCNVWADFIYLDTDERRRFAQVSHEYLIEQVQREEYTLIESASNSLKLNFNHPVKEIIWTTDPFIKYEKAQLKLNGNDRFAAQEEEYFQLRQPFDYHTSIPSYNNYINTSKFLSVLNNKTSKSSLDDISKVHISIFAGGISGQITFFDDTSDAKFVSVGDTIIISNTTSPEKGGVIKIIAHTNSSESVNGGSLTGILFNFLVISSGQDTGTSMVQPDDNDGILLFLIKENISTNIGENSNILRKINCYSFSLKPEEHQPSGTCNFSRIDNASLEIGTTSKTSSSNQFIGQCIVYAINYNVLRIMSGMAGLAYSN